MSYTFELFYHGEWKPLLKDGEAVVITSLKATRNFARNNLIMSHHRILLNGEVTETWVPKIP